MRFKRFHSIFLVSTILLLAAACGGTQDPGGAVEAIEAYNQALVAKDADRLATLSCANWEADAQTELESFGAVETELEEMECAESGTEGEITLVSCTGIISADYDGEILEINLSDRTYQAVFEAGEWRMCGYR